MPSSIQRKMAGGAVWMVLLALVERSLGLISMLILARLLGPTDFGVVGMALSFIVMAQLMSTFGFDIALIHDQDATESHYHTAWTFNVLIGVVILLVMLAAAGPISAFYSHPEVFPVVCVLALGPLIGGLENIGVVAFRKDLDFRKEFLFQISRKIIGFCVTVPLAFWLRNYWALVAGTLAARLAGTAVSYLSHPFRPRLSFAKTASLLRFSGWLLLNNSLGFLKERLSDFIVGRQLGAGALGLYNVSYEFSHLPTTEIGAPINRALLPGFAKLSEPGAVQSAYVNAMGMLAIVAIPAAVGISAVAHFFIPVVLGGKWIDGVPLMEVLSISGAFLMFQSSICSILISKGFPSTATRTNAFFVALLLALMLLLTPRFGALGAAYAVLATTTSTMPAYVDQLRLRIGVPISAFVYALARPATAAAGMFLVIRAALPHYSTALPALHAAAWLVTGVVLGTITYVFFVSMLWFAAGRPPGAERLILDTSRRRLVRLFSKRRVVQLKFRHSRPLRNAVGIAGAQKCFRENAKNG
ncbi:MAG: lipopolysaccharide biosynthesis protein [Sterolibacteriaceae bacterium]|uniref:Lipopolysaccharide biosynthesis protein n=1 Tax=Candidatus Methylophosphatis roskildensis TaxID=2899263 RepID=A0A9D7E2Z5_9PROT|nr:lipopolysaccharide biosynthesis protein [Candidatus Methylophosphatis roskildensis]MBK7235696.1 lipopolysaccharide biosynthesis protein [Sterolibacteriaceae bacterium]